MERSLPTLRSLARNGRDWRVPSVLIGLVLASVACGRPTSDAPSLQTLTAQARQVEGLESLIVWHRDSVQLELYLHGTADTLRDVRSITKSVTSLLVGIAIGQRKLPSVDQPMTEALGRERMSDEVRAADIRLRHLLTMSTGIRWGSEDIGLYQSWRASDDPVAFYLQRPMASQPGQTFSYSSAAAHLLGAVIEKATGTALPRFADRHLFAPMGIERVQWQGLSGGQTNAGGALQLRARDLLSLGLLVLEKGRYQDRQIVPGEWIEQSTRNRIEAGNGNEVGYGYLWWVGEVDGKTLIMAQGFGGQTLAILPELNLVVANTSRWRRISGTTAERQARAIQSFYMEYLMPWVVARERAAARRAPIHR